MMRRPSADAIWSAISWLECYEGDGGDSLENVKRVTAWLTELAMAEEAQSAALCIVTRAHPDLPKAEQRRLARDIAAKALRSPPGPGHPDAPTPPLPRGQP